MRAIRSANYPQEDLVAIEQKIVSDLKESQSKTPRVLINQILIVDSLSTRDQYADFQKEVLAKVQDSIKYVTKKDQKDILRYMENVRNPSEQAISLFNQILDSSY